NDTGGGARYRDHGVSHGTQPAQGGAGGPRVGPGAGGHGHGGAGGVHAARERGGARAAGSPAEAVRDADVVITTLPTAAVVESVMFGNHVAEAFAPGAVWAQMGTISVEATEQTAARLEKIRPGLLFVDAPVSGSKGPAEQGQLLIL